MSNACNVDSTWHPKIWRDHAAEQQPTWPDDAELEQAEKELCALPPLVFAGEARSLTTALARVANSEAFLLQAGDCAESFDGFSADAIRDKLRVILQMAAALTYSGGVPVVKVGRIAGQFAKPRSSSTEKRGDIELPSFRGHIVNDVAFNPEARVPDPRRLIQAYHQSASTLNLLRAFTQGGFAGMNQVHAWNQEFVASSPIGQQYERVAEGIDKAMRFMAACGIDMSGDPNLTQVDFYTSHEALLLQYEEALTRQDSMTGEWYDCSAHMLWVGERTRDLSGAHIAFLRGVQNPLGCKIGPSATPQDVLGICEALNPNQIPGRLTLITRMGSKRVRELLPPLLKAVNETGHPVVWACDPMHGNTFTANSGHKTRHLEDVLDELRGFFEAHHSVGTWPGGVHVELTGEDVTECLGGSAEVTDETLDRRYETMCDPRLNARQSLDLAFRVSEWLHGNEL